MTQPDLSCPLRALLAQQPPAEPSPRRLDISASGQPPRLLHKLDGAADLLSISKTKLYGLLRTDAIPSLMLGGQRYIAHEDLVTFVDQLRAEAGPWTA